MTTELATERDMLVRVMELKKKEEGIAAELKRVSKELANAEVALTESMLARGVKSTAKYDGIGWGTLEKPELYARCNKEYETQLFDFLKSVGRADLIKSTVHHATLKSFVKETIEKGEKGAKLPEFIQYGFNNNLLTYAR